MAYSSQIAIPRPLQSWHLCFPPVWIHIGRASCACSVRIAAPSRLREDEHRRRSRVGAVAHMGAALSGGSGDQTLRASSPTLGRDVRYALTSCRVETPWHRDEKHALRQR
jgi:hypothetical protein